MPFLDVPGRFVVAVGGVGPVSLDLNGVPSPVLTEEGGDDKLLDIPFGFYLEELVEQRLSPDEGQRLGTDRREGLWFGLRLREPLGQVFRELLDGGGVASGIRDGLKKRAEAGVPRDVDVPDVPLSNPGSRRRR